MQRNVLETVMGAVVLLAAAAFLFIIYSAAGVKESKGGYHLIMRLDRGGSVEVVTAWQPPPSPLGSVSWHYRSRHRWAVRAQQAAMAQAARFLGQVPPVTGIVVEGDPATVLARAGEGAACIVLGEGRADRPGDGCESTRGRCAALAHCPVLVAPSLVPDARSRHGQHSPPR